MTLAIVNAVFLVAFVALVLISEARGGKENGK